MNISISPRPAKPEQAYGEHDTANHDLWETPFRESDIVVGRKLAVEGWHNDDHGRGTSRHNADAQRQKGETRDARAEVVHTLEDEWVGGEEEVYQRIDEGHVEADKEENGLCGKHDSGAREILGHQFPEINLYIIVRGMDSPITRTSADFGGFRGKDDGRIGLVLREDGKSGA